jgi:ABC-2 type transport system ATP-binding protein
MQEVEALCQRAIIISKGRIVADDNLEDLRKRSSGRSFIAVEFDRPPAPGKLNSMQQVISIVSIPGRSSAWKLETAKPDELRRELMELSLKEGLNILSLQNESQSLESVFQLLTLPTEKK